LEAGALQHTAQLPAVPGRSPLLRLQSDERLIALIRRGQHAAFDALVQRYQSRLLAFCRHMLGCTEDAEDVLQEVFASAFNAILADEREINARPWLYRIARNRCLNHLRRPVPTGHDSMDVFERDGGATTADTVHKREEFRQIVSDVQDLPETQKTALLLREIDALSYDQIAEAMDTTVPSVKSLLVRARVSLAEAAEARLLTCGEVRLELGQVAEGITKTTAPVRRHLKGCERCRVFRSELRRTNRALAAVYPVSALVLVKKFFIAKIGVSAASQAGASGSGAAAAAAGAGGSALSAGVSTIATKAVAGVAAAAIVTAGAVEVKQYDKSPRRSSPNAAAAVAAPPLAPPQGIVRPRVLAVDNVVAPALDPQADANKKKDAAAKKDAKSAKDAKSGTQTTQTDPAKTSSTPTATSTTQQPTTTQQDGSTVALAPGSKGGTADHSGSTGGSTSSGGQSGSGSGSSSPPGESSGSQPQPAPIVGEPPPPVSP
jgi:RNA polymerase sigma factor (sigma-70 family)